jgi:BON domain
MLSDKLLEAQINSALEDHVSMAMAPGGVIVSATNGRVNLTGVTSSGSLRAKAERVTQSIAGVYEIDNRIVSVPPWSSSTRQCHSQRLNLAHRDLASRIYVRQRSLSLRPSGPRLPPGHARGSP